jgi:hypothetical protein
VERSVFEAVEKSRCSREYPTAAVVRLAGLLHAEEQQALKHIAWQLCDSLGHQFVPGASFEENLSFFRQTLETVSRYVVASSCGNGLLATAHLSNSFEWPVFRVFQT